MMPAQNHGLLDTGSTTQNLPEHVRLTNVANIARRVFHLLSPSLRASRATSIPLKLRPTSYLDGLRGFAAFIVYWHHHILWAHEPQLLERKFQAGFGQDGEHYFGAFPLIRTFTTGGHYSVAIFFILSGYVLSTKPLTLIHSGDLIASSDNLASALFRRWFRLWIPVIVVTFCMITICHSFGIIFGNFTPAPAYGAEVWKWYGDIKKFSFFYAELDVPWFSYSMHAWTIPVELKGSVLIYITVLALSRCTWKARVGSLAALVFYLLYIVDGSYYAMFVTGILIAYIDLLAVHDVLPTWTHLSQRTQAFLSPSLLVAGIFLGGVPSHSNELTDLRDTPGWFLLSYLKPAAVFNFKWFYLYWAGVLTIISIPRIRWAKAFMETPFCQFLGRISYMLYLIHGPILWSIGDRLYAATGWPRLAHLSTLPNWLNICVLPKFGPLGLEVGFLIPCLLLLIPTLWIAEIATRLIDGPSVDFAMFLYKKTLPIAEDEV